MNLSQIDASRWPHWRSDDGNVLLINADCLDVLPVLPSEIVIVSDPPYGVAWDTGKNRAKSRGKFGVRKELGVEFSAIFGDERPFDPSPFIGFKCILFGANHYASRLPNSGAWIVWDKRMHVASTDQSDCELAWSNIGNRAAMIRYLYHGGLCIAKENKVKVGRGLPVGLHPTQKPVEVMLKCIEFTGNAQAILDPFTGSGTTGVACVRLGRQFIGIELEPKYYEIAIKRIKAEIERFPLFEKASKPVTKPLPGFGEGE